MKIIVTDEFANMIETDAKVLELLKKARARKIKELVEQGIDKMIAAVMVDTLPDYGMHI